MRRSASAVLAAGVLCLAAVPSVASPMTGYEPPRKIGAVVRATDRLGWPHLVTKPERLAITVMMLRIYTPKNEYGDALCKWPRGTTGLAKCDGRTADYNWRARIRVFEDGSFKYTTLALTER